MFLAARVLTGLITVTPVNHDDLDDFIKAEARKEDMSALRTKTGTSNPTTLYEIGEDGHPIYPCRCGEDHVGPYGCYDWGHHSCFHEKPLIPGGTDLTYCCVDCGMVFWLKDRMDKAHAEGRLRY